MSLCRSKGLYYEIIELFKGFCPIEIITNYQLCIKLLLLSFKYIHIYYLQ